MNETDTLTLKSMQELMTLKFFVPYYQRGYRWKEQQVLELLEDFAAFRKSQRTPFYFLQALVVAKGMDGRYHVVDGQQRLITLALLLAALGVNAISEAPDSWMTFARDAWQPLDSYYRERAKECMRDWLDAHEGLQKTLRETVLHAAFLFYEVPPDEEGATFRRLNSGKIGALDSELVKCVLLTPQVDESPETTRARAEEWDAMERALNDEEFFRFFTPRNAWRQEDRMSMVLRYAGFCPSGKERGDDTCPFLKKVRAEIAATSRESV